MAIQQIDQEQLLKRLVIDCSGNAVADCSGNILLKGQCPPSDGLFGATGSPVEYLWLDGYEDGDLTACAGCNPAPEIGGVIIPPWEGVFARWTGWEWRPYWCAGCAESGNIDGKRATWDGGDSYLKLDCENRRWEIRLACHPSITPIWTGFKPFGDACYDNGTGIYVRSDGCSTGPSSLAIRTCTPVDIGGAPLNVLGYLEPDLIERDSAYSWTPTRIGGNPGGTWYLDGSLPAGLSFNSTTGEVSGTATATTGTLGFQLFYLEPTADQVPGGVWVYSAERAINPCHARRTLQLRVACPAATALNDSGLGTATVRQSYSGTVTAPVDAQCPTYTWSRTSGSLPAGIFMGNHGGFPFTTASANFFGTPTATGSYTFAVRAERETGYFDQTVNITVVCPTITLSPTTLPSGTVGVAYDQYISQSGGRAINPGYNDGSNSFVVSTGSIPTGLTFATTFSHSGPSFWKGRLNGTPSGAGTFNFEVLFTDADSCTATQSYSVIIA